MKYFTVKKRLLNRKKEKEATDRMYRHTRRSLKMKRD